MAEVADRFPIRAWKAYTHAGGPGWWLDDPLGDVFLDQAVALGLPTIAVHKGFGRSSEYSAPRDVGPAAAAHPDVDLVIYHSGYDVDSTEGPYDPEGQGVDRLVRSLEEAGVEPGANVYAELGSTWRSVMGSPDQAAHVLGKVLLAVGEDNVCWGTDSIWYGSPQDQIEAFRAFEITPEFQDRFGYPALTPSAEGEDPGRQLGPALRRPAGDRPLPPRSGRPGGGPVRRRGAQRRARPHDRRAGRRRVGRRRTLDLALTHTELASDLPPMTGESEASSGGVRRGPRRGRPAPGGRRRR